MILLIGNTKGGVGKTTLAVNIAISRALAGRRVFLVDADRQLTAQTSISVRAANLPSEPMVACSAYSDGLTLRTQVKLQKSNFDDVVIDAGGKDSSALRAALTLADVLVTPFRPRSFDVWSLEQMAELVDEARGLHENLQAFAVLSAADPSNSSDNRDARDYVEQLPQFKYLPAQISQRKAFSNAAGAGRCVTEMKPRDPKAIAELASLVDSLF